MRPIFRRLRGAFGTALTWAVAWIPIGVVLQAAQRTEHGTFRGFHFNPLDAASWAIVGAIGGLIFSLLTATDGRRTLPQISLKRSGMWGLFAAIAVPLAFEGTRWIIEGRLPGWWTVQMLASFGVAGALSAAGMVWLARRAEAHEPPDEQLSIVEEAAAALLAEANHLSEHIAVDQNANVRA